MSDKTEYTAYLSLTLNGKHFKGRNGLDLLIKQCEKSEEHEHRLIAQFILEWINDSDFITLQTSGSTGQAKLIKVKKSAMLASAKRTIRFFNLQANQTALLCLSAQYIAGKMMLVRAIVGGFNLITSSVSSDPLMGLNQTIDFVAMVPLQLSTIVQNNIDDLSRVKKILVGGSALSTSLRDKLMQIGCEVWESYGMTETVSHIAVRSIGEHAFRVLDGIQISKNDQGCLVIHPSDVNETMLITTDLIELYSDFDFSLLGRLDNIINSGGVKVVPEEVEKKLQAYISNEFVISWKSDLKLGQKVVLVLESGSVCDVELSQLSCLSKYQIPKEMIYVDEFPRTDTGKVKRKKLQELIS
ncbi:AMP-binding protein [Carboxylicivirga sp. M1479]|uniref:AMP-binding protein n=1 Tax=Carboxylicivirga sp. M1479 TaxID=2594476 RepID=UPI001178559C|nr:AMP-binding protein [Carboxylicivirga sp. M1479]TRX63253.1 AMP-binding protein [Carboxylicivirga sp. M1479]